MSLTNTAEDKFLNFMRDGTTGTAYSNPHLMALFTADPTEAPTNAAASVTNEIQVGTHPSYARKSIAWGTVSGGSMANSAQEDFALALTDWGTASHFVIYSTNNFGIWKGAFSVAKQVLTNDTARIAAGALVVTLD